MDMDKENFKSELAYDLEPCSSSDFPNTAENLLGEYDIVLVDLPGNLLQEGVISCYFLFDFVFCPTSVSYADLQSTITFISLYKEKIEGVRKENGFDCNFYVLLNKVDSKTKEFKEFKEMLVPGENKRGVIPAVAYLNGKSEEGDQPVEVLTNHLSTAIAHMRNLSTFESYQVSKKDSDEVGKLCNEMLSIINLVKVSK
jgi:cellulose biosynthesis protein BcsQ